MNTMIGRAMAVATLLVAVAACADVGADPGTEDGGDAAAEVAASGGAAGETGAASVARVEPGRMEVPAAAGSGEPFLHSGPAGTYLSWLEPTAPRRHALRFARWEDGGWGEPRTVLDREGLFVNWADFPSLLPLGDGTLAAHWLQRSGDAPYAYDVRMAISRDGGATWGPDILPHRDGVEAEHGFVSLFPVGDSIGAIWLDGRATPDGDPMTLRFTTIARDGGLGEETRLDASVCDCCQTAVALTDAGPVAVYRDRTGAEVRDIGVTRRIDGRWTRGERVHADDWVIAACPVNGPAIDAAGRRVAVAWFTAPGDSGRVNVAFSDDAGASFGPPVRADDGAPLGRVDVVLLEDGSAVVSWLERSPEGAQVRLRRVAPGRAGSSVAAVATDAARSSGFPQMVRHDGHLLLAWTATGGSGGNGGDGDARHESRVRSGLVQLPAVPALEAGS